ncbi:hypothetical protein WJX72_003384 [[Myrmecia] bisecta]|uniref:Uncharacterized protein n=1 Tax=[Myrmecia] bisecta TaxID=41462 RepID=A0AAW1PTE9_9CHLO
MYVARVASVAFFWDRLRVAFQPAFVIVYVLIWVAAIVLRSQLGPDDNRGEECALIATCVMLALAFIATCIGGVYKCCTVDCPNLGPIFRNFNRLPLSSTSKYHEFLFAAVLDGPTQGME